MATQTPTIITQGTQNQDGSGVNKYNPNTGNLLLPNQSVQVNPVNGIGQQPPTIPAPVGLGNIKPVVPAQPQNGTATTTANANNAAMMTQPQFEAQTNQNVQNYGQAYQQSSQDYQQQILNQINNREANTANIQQSTGYTKALGDYNQATAAYQSLNDAFSLKKKAVLTNQSLTAEDQQRRLNAVNVEETIAKTDAIIDYNIKKGSFDTIKELTDQKINIMLEGDKMRIEALKQQKEDNKDLFTRAEDKQFNLMIKKQEQAFQEKQDKLKFQQSLQLKAMDIAADAQKAGYGAGLTYDQIKNVKNYKDLAKMTAQSSGGSITDNMTSAVTNMSTILSKDKREVAVPATLKYLQKGDYGNAYVQMANATSESLTGEPKTKFDAARIDVGVMKGLADSIKKYQDAGGNMSLLKGKADEIDKNLGKLSNDPKFTELAVQMQREFQAYRSQMTGAAFTDKESRDYARVNPTGNKSIDLNYSIINGAVSQLTNRVNSTIDAKLGNGAADVRNGIVQGQVAQQTVAQTAQQYPTEFKTSVTNFYTTNGRMPTNEEQSQIAQYIAQNK